MGNQLTGYCQWSILQISTASRNLPPCEVACTAWHRVTISVHYCEHRINLLSHGVVRRGHGGTGRGVKEPSQSFKIMKEALTLGLLLVKKLIFKNLLRHNAKLA